MFKQLFRKRGSAIEHGFTMVEIAVAVGIVLLLTVAGIVGFSTVQRNAEIAAVEQSADQGFTAAMSGAFTAAEIEEDLTTEDITVSVFNLSPALLGMSGDSGGLRSMSTSSIMPAAVEHQEPCVLAEGYDYRATRGECADIEEGSTPGGEDESEQCEEEDDSCIYLAEKYRSGIEDPAYADAPYTLTVVRHLNGADEEVVNRSGEVDPYGYVNSNDGFEQNIKRDRVADYSPTYTITYDFGDLGVLKAEVLQQHFTKDTSLDFRQDWESYTIFTPSGVERR